MISVLITDDHPIVRQGIRQILEDDKDQRFGLIEEAVNGKELIEKISKKDFDVILLDISLPDRSGLDLLSEVKKRTKLPSVLILSIYPEEQYALKALKLGASGYLTKASAPSELINAIIKVSTGGRYITSSLAENITFGMIDNINTSEKALHDNLSIRELEVIYLMASGKTLTSIADELSLSPKTISTYRERILSKLKLKTTSDIIRYAINNGLA
jgi:two-component system, NarL family, invasion response regulator UvrY